MAQSLVSIWVHAVWSTQHRTPLILPHFEEKLHQALFEEFTDAGSYVMAINGMPDHVHVLFSLPSTLALSKLIKQAKGATSHFINRQNWLQEKFTWQNGYGAFGVSESLLGKTERYINNQKKIHQHQTYDTELLYFTNAHRLLNGTKHIHPPHH